MNGFYFTNFSQSSHDLLYPTKSQLCQEFLGMDSLLQLLHVHHMGAKNHMAPM
jgi:hypothetical protein